MRIRTFLVSLLLSLTLLPTLQAREFWNGTECVVCPEETEYAPGATNQPNQGSGKASPEQLGRLLDRQAFVAQGVSNSTPDRAAAYDTPSLLYMVVGPIKHIDIDRHQIIVKNRLNHKEEKILVYDSILTRLRERNVVEVWKKPGSDLAERINRIS